MSNPLIQAKNVFSNLFNNKLLGKNIEKLNIADIPNNSGNIIELNGVKTAVYKDSSGNITKLNTKCTHMGCDVEWNSNKNEWHCPCHNSNFKATGEVINGPAKKDLEKMI